MLGNMFIIRISPHVVGGFWNVDNMYIDTLETKYGTIIRSIDSPRRGH